MPSGIVGVTAVSANIRAPLLDVSMNYIQEDTGILPHMATDQDVDTSRTVVQVYVPAYQRDLWDEDADEMDMSRSEFVKAMVQAGRRGFGGEPAEDTEISGECSTETNLQSRILDTLEEHNCLSWDDLLAEVTGDVESRLDSTLKALQDDGEIRYSGREGGYIIDSGGD